MDIVSDLPFELQIIKRFPELSYQQALDFSADAALAWVNEPINVVMSKYNIKK